MTTTVVFYATDTMADWEYGYLLAGLAMANGAGPGSFRVLVASEDGGAVTSKGGVRVTPEVSLADVAPAEIAALVLPGADTWFTGHETALAWPSGRSRPAGWWPRSAERRTVWPATGLLDDRDHTSNAATSSPEHPGTAAPRATARPAPSTIAA